MTTSEDQDLLIVLSHLRWDWVWQRPQHLISRLGRPGSTYFVEEPNPVEGLSTPHERRVDGDVTRLWLDVPADERWIGFREREHDAHLQLVEAALPPSSGQRIVWMYTALALELAVELAPDVLVYDVMDDLASFKDAAPEQQLRHRAALHEADVVFTGGRSLHAGATAVRSADVHCFPSGVEVEHFAVAGEMRARRRREEIDPRPVAGYVGVLDERVDWDLVADVADALPGWSFVMVGPIAKVDPGSLPVRPNLHLVGPRDYATLPAAMASFDVGLMPFARNDATRSISPTKTLEYLAAQLPVVSTPIADVVDEYGSVVRIAGSAGEFAAACEASLREPPDQRHVSRVLRSRHWDTIAAEMSSRIAAHVDVRVGRVANG